MAGVKGLTDEVIQAQGGWASVEVMRSFYSRFTDDERKRILLDAAVSSGPESTRSPKNAEMTALTG